MHQMLKTKMTTPILLASLLAGCHLGGDTPLDEPRTASQVGMTDGAAGGSGSGGSSTVPEKSSISCDVTEFAVPTDSSGPAGLTVGADSNLWFTESQASKIGRITLTGTITEYAVPNSFSLLAITAGPDGNLWFTDQGGWIGRITPDGTITEFPVTTTGAGAPRGIAAGPDGNLWFTDSSGRIGRMTTTGKIDEFSLPSASLSSLANSTQNPMSITTGPDGNLWFTEFEGTNIGRITTKGVITEFVLGTFRNPNAIVAGPDGNLWFTEFYGSPSLGIGRITPKGTINEFPIPTLNSNPNGIVAAPDGNLWFAESSGNKIAYITPSGTIVECPALVAAITAYPSGIVVGPDGNLWFTESASNKIAHTNPSGGNTPPFDGSTVQPPSDAAAD
jgi:streptogramin lyase